MEPITGINGMDVARLLERSSGGGPALESMGREFANLMAQAPERHPVPEVGAKTFVGELVSQHDNLYNSYMRDIKAMPEQMAGKSAMEVTMKGMELAFRASEVHLQHTGYTTVAQSVKNGLQTLMKNQ